MKAGICPNNIFQPSVLDIEQSLYADLMGLAISLGAIYYLIFAHKQGDT